MEYFPEAYLYDYETKYAIFAAFEMLSSIFEAIGGALQGTHSKAEAIEALRKLNQSWEGGEGSPDEAERKLRVPLRRKGLTAQLSMRPRGRAREQRRMIAKALDDGTERTTDPFRDPVSNRFEPIFARIPPGALSTIFEPSGGVNIPPESRVAKSCGADRY